MKFLIKRKLLVEELHIVEIEAESSAEAMKEALEMDIGDYDDCIVGDVTDDEILSVSMVEEEE